MSGARAQAAPLALVGAAAGALALGACGSSASSPSSAANASSSTKKGAVAVIYAGSLAKLMEDDIGPSFQRSSGYAFQGYGGGSGEDAKAIAGGVRRVDVFVSASAEADKTLEGAAGGNWVSWYATFATTPLMLGYDPKSKFGEQLAHGKPWYEALTQPGIRVGRTDPKLDPKGKLTVQAVQEAAAKLGKPALAKALSSFPVFPETDLVGRLQAGQLDAGFFYAIEANVAHIPTVALTPAKQTAAYTLTVVNRAPHQAGAEAFVRYLLQAGTASALTADGLTPIAPITLSGPATAVPAGLRAALGASGP